MAVLKYKNASGDFVAISNYNVQPITPVQTTGSSTTDIMSQNAVTTALGTKQNTIAFNTTYNASSNKAATMKDIPSHGTATSGSSTNSVVTLGEMYNWNAAYAEAVTFGLGANTATTVASLPVTKRLVIVTNPGTASLSLASLPAAGREIHVIINATSAATITIPHGTSGSITYVNTNDGASSKMSVSAGKYGEINIVSDGSKAYIRYIA